MVQNWLKLTLIGNARPVYVCRNWIVSVRPAADEHATIVATTQGEFAVQESVDSIMAMI